MRCLYCDAKLPLYRKLTSGQFCSATHRKSYWQEQERLAVERLHETHDSLRAYRPTGDIELILGKPLENKDYYPLEEAAAQAPPVKKKQAHTPTPQVEEMARSASNTGSVIASAGFVAEPRPSGYAWGDAAVAVEPEVMRWPAITPAIPAYAVELSAGDLAMASRLGIPRFGSKARVEAARFDADPVLFVVRPSTQVALAMAPDTYEMKAAWLAGIQAAAAQEAAAELLRIQVQEQEPQEIEPPLAHVLFLLPAGEIRDAAGVIKRSTQEPLSTTGTARKNGMTAPAVALAPRTSGLQRLSRFTPVAIAAAAAADTAAPIDFAIPAVVQKIGMPMQQAGALEIAADHSGMHTLPRMAPQGMAPAIVMGELAPLAPPPHSAAAWSRAVQSLATPGLEPRLGLAPGCRYAIAGRSETFIAKRVEPLESKLAVEWRGLPEGFGEPALTPRLGTLARLDFSMQLRAPQPPSSRVAECVALPVHLEPMQRRARWEPIEGAMEPAPPKSFFALPASASQGLAEAMGQRHVWTHAVDFWNNAPRDMKMLAVAIPLLLALALRPSLPKVRVTAPAASGEVQSSLARGFRAQLLNVRQSVSERAAVALDEDFRAGLDNWQMRDEKSTAWSFDATGFVKPGSLALYKPSMNLGDYEMQFLGLIDKKSLSWVARAEDFDNYEVVKLVVLKPGPLQTLGITHYAVVNGQPQKALETIAPINARPDMLYRVSLIVRDDTYLLALQGKVVDTWSEPRLKRGGIGFFSTRGEESRVRWVQVTHQYDILGRLCAYLVPYDIQTTNGSW